MGGLVIATLGVEWVYAVNALTFLCVMLALLMMRDVPARGPGEVSDISVRAVREGLGFVFSVPDHPLDDAARLFRDVLLVGNGPAADLRAGRSARRRERIWLALRRALGGRRAHEFRDGSLDRADRTEGRRADLGGVRVRTATIVFGLSRSFWLTFLCLAVTGAADTVSMVLRNVIRQLGTPDHLRGRMVGVNMVFLQGGPQLGELEAGAVAQWFGPRASVVTGGLGCLIATAWIAARTPALRRYRRSFIDGDERGRLRSVVR